MTTSIEILEQLHDQLPRDHPERIGVGRAIDLLRAEEYKDSRRKKLRLEVETTFPSGRTNVTLSSGEVRHWAWTDEGQLTVQYVNGAQVVYSIIETGRGDG